MGSRINFGWGPFDQKLEVVVTFIRLNRDWRAPPPPDTHHFPKQDPSTIFETYIFFSIVEGSSNHSFENSPPPSKVLRRRAVC